jgi:C-terminal processing protease CtpA/Prc
VDALGATLVEKDRAWVVVAVLDGGPARALGWRPQDRIIAVNGEKPRGGKSEALKTFSPGRTLKVRIWRDGWEKVFDVKLEAETEGDEF